MSDQREAGVSLPSLRLSRLIREAQAVLLAISVGYFTVTTTTKSSLTVKSIESVGARKNPLFCKRHNVKELQPKTRERIGAGLKAMCQNAVLDTAYSQAGAAGKVLDARSPLVYPDQSPDGRRGSSARAVHLRSQERSAS